MIYCDEIIQCLKSHFILSWFIITGSPDQIWSSLMEQGEFGFCSLFVKAETVVFLLLVVFIWIATHIFIIKCSKKSIQLSPVCSACSSPLQTYFSPFQRACNEKVYLLGYIYCVSTSGSEMLSLNVSGCSWNWNSCFPPCSHHKKKPSVRKHGNWQKWDCPSGLVCNLLV